MTARVPIDAALLRTWPLPQPDRDTNKNSRGSVLIAGGSSVSPGGPMLAGLAALRAGAGKVSLVVPRPMAIDIAVAFPEAGVHPFSSERDGTPRPGLAAREIRKLLDKADVALIGPGLADEPTAQELLRRVLTAMTGDRHFVIDAMALTGLWNETELLAPHAARTVITPHPGEMAALTGLTVDEVCAEPERIARDVAARLGCLVVLKGATTVVAPREGSIYVHEGDCVGLATSGSGDVLAGILSALVARGAPTTAAAAWAVWLHARAGNALSQRMGPLGFLARELIPEIPQLMGERVMTEISKPKDAGAKPSEAGRRPHDPPSEHPEDLANGESGEESAGRDVQRAFEQGITRLPPG